MFLVRLLSKAAIVLCKAAKLWGRRPHFYVAPGTSHFCTLSTSGQFLNLDLKQSFLPLDLGENGQPLESTSHARSAVPPKRL